MSIIDFFVSFQRTNVPQIHKIILSYSVGRDIINDKVSEGKFYFIFFKKKKFWEIP